MSLSAKSLRRRTGPRRPDSRPTRFWAEAQMLELFSPMRVEPILAKISSLSVEAKICGTSWPSTGTLMTWAPLRMPRTRACSVTPRWK